jgi:CubicO group peptidase (beta-lactamase class C family)
MFKNNSDHKFCGRCLYLNMQLYQLRLWLNNFFIFKQLRSSLLQIFRRDTSNRSNIITLLRLDQVHPFGGAPSLFHILVLDADGNPIGGDDRQVIRLLHNTRRNDLAKQVKKRAEESKVAVRNGTSVDIVAAKRPINIRDLLTHTAGISYGTDASVSAQYEAKGLGPAAGYGWYTADKDEPICVTMERLGTLPFVAQPGEAWVYGYNTDILGCIVEKASGRPLDEFVRTRITGPLGMKDTQFFLPADQRARLAAVYTHGNDGTIKRAPDGPRGQGTYVDGPRKSFAGGAGLLSTARDYARFLEMTRKGGILDGVRILSPRSVALMTTNQSGALRCPPSQADPCGSARGMNHSQLPRHGTRVAAVPSTRCAMLMVSSPTALKAQSGTKMRRSRWRTSRAAEPSARHASLPLQVEDEHSADVLLVRGRLQVGRPRQILVAVENQKRRMRSRDVRDRRRVLDDHPLPAVGGPDAHAITLADAAREQAPRGKADRLPQLPIARPVALVPDDERLPVAEALDGPTQVFPDRFAEQRHGARPVRVGEGRHPLRLARLKTRSPDARGREVEFSMIR